ncbi:MAG: zinc ribbon domain-containing protein [Deltaproteobacteria bacterium]|nr:zinc ribbon domain-containing protein [Deltaproteobacteria bacterium]
MLIRLTFLYIYKDLFMPIYEFECLGCHKVSEVFLYRKDEAAPDTCQHCGGKLKKLVSQAAFHLKGGGWYKDLYSSKKTEGSVSTTQDKKTVSDTSEKKETSSEKSKPSTPSPSPSSPKTKKDS